MVERRHDRSHLAVQASWRAQPVRELIGSPMSLAAMIAVGPHAGSPGFLHLGSRVINNVARPLGGAAQNGILGPDMDAETSTGVGPNPAVLAQLAKIGLGGPWRVC